MNLIKRLMAAIDTLFLLWVSHDREEYVIRQVEFFLRFWKNSYRDEEPDWINQDRIRVIDSALRGNIFGFLKLRRIIREEIIDSDDVERISKERGLAFLEEMIENNFGGIWDKNPTFGTSLSSHEYIKEKEKMAEYELLKQGEKCADFTQADSIKCLRCGIISYNKNDVIHTYCGRCHRTLREHG
jgi:ribosomal protein S27AE